MTYVEYATGFRFSHKFKNKSQCAVAKKISKENFIRILVTLYRIDLSEIEINNLFNHFDKEKKKRN